MKKFLVFVAAAFFAARALGLNVPLVDEVWAGVACGVASFAL